MRKVIVSRMRERYAQTVLTLRITYVSICHSVWVAVLSAGWTQLNSQPPTHSDKYQCRIHTVHSPDDGHIDDRNMYSSENRYIERYVHLVGLICKWLYGDARSTKHSISLVSAFSQLFTCIKFRTDFRIILQWRWGLNANNCAPKCIHVLYVHCTEPGIGIL